MKIFSIKEIIDILNKLSHKIKCLCQSLTKGHVMMEDLTLPNQSISEMDASGITNSSFFPFIKPAAGKGGYENFKISKANLASALGGGGGATPISTDISNATDNDSAAGALAAKQYVDSKKTLIGTTTGNDTTDELIVQGARLGYDPGVPTIYFGPNAGLNNTQDNATLIGEDCGRNNSGDGGITAMGYRAAYLNTFNHINAFGNTAQATADNQTVFGNPTNPIEINHAVIQNTAKSLKVTIGGTDYWIVLATSEPV